MNISHQYIMMCHMAEEIQSKWIPTEGDFWICACDSCLNSKRLNIIEHADELAYRKISETYDAKSKSGMTITCGDLLEGAHNADISHYFHSLRVSYRTSLDCGFGQFWVDYKINERGHVWLPRMDQLIDMYMKFFQHDKKNTIAGILFKLATFTGHSPQHPSENIEYYMLNMLMYDCFYKRWNRIEKNWNSTTNDFSPDVCFRSAQICTGNKNPDMWEIRGINHLRKTCDCFKIKTLTHKNKKLFFDNVKMGAIFKYDSGFLFEEVKEIASNAGYLIEYCDPLSEEYRKHGTYTCRIISKTTNALIDNCSKQ